MNLFTLEIAFFSFLLFHFFFKLYAKCTVGELIEPIHKSPARLCSFLCHVVLAKFRDLALCPAIACMGLLVL